MYRADTIVARATGAGRGAVAIVRISGSEVVAITSKLFRSTRGRPDLEPWKLRLGVACDPRTGASLDQVLAVFMPGPASYTGEDVLEIHCHGGPVVVEKLLGAALAAGARPAEAGEFTRRAVLNGKMDLLQAEAVADLIDARVSGGAEMAWEQLQGSLSGRLAEVRKLILGVLADLEANVDFTDEELPEEDEPARVDGLRTAYTLLEDLVGGFELGRRQREGCRTVVAGRPNVGKSSLVNRLLGTGRMIVTDEAGTTRDSVEETVELGGQAFVLVDTAGVRDTDSRAEAAAIDRSCELAAISEILVFVVDSSEGLSVADLDVLRRLGRLPDLFVLNKSDLEGAFGEADLVSALRDSGVPGGDAEVPGSDSAVGGGPLPAAPRDRTGRGSGGLREVGPGPLPEGLSGVYPSQSEGAFGGDMGGRGGDFRAPVGAGSDPIGARILSVSAQNGDGIEAFTAALIGLSGTADRPPAAISRVRHREALERAMDALVDAVGRAPLGDAEITSLEVRRALGELSAITDPVDNEQVLDVIFREFCIGK